MAWHRQLKEFLGLRKRKLDIAALRKRYPHFEFGRGTYGKPAIMEWGEPATLRVGAFCSIAAEVTESVAVNETVPLLAIGVSVPASPGAGLFAPVLIV